MDGKQEAVVVVKVLSVGVKTAARMLGIGERNVGYMIERGELRAFRHGRRVLLAERDLETWVEQQRAACPVVKVGSDVERING